MTKGKMNKRKNRLFLDSDTALDLMRVALGEKKASLVIRNGKVLNVYTGELLEGWSISVIGKRIAYVGEDVEHTIGRDTALIEAKGKTIIPGFIDGHAHLAWLFCAREFLNYAMKSGTTTLITETMESFPVAGVEGVVDFMASLQNQPVKIFATAPAMGSISKAARGIPKSVLKKLLSHPYIIGLGESYWQGVLQETGKFLPAFTETLRSGKIVEGHSAGAKGKKLVAYAALGVSSCHEPVKPEEVLERLRLGFWVMIREGSIRRDLETISSIKDQGIDLRRLVLVTDGITPEDLLEKGHMEYVIQKAIDCGFDPVAAIQMGTLNAAEHFRLDNLIGGIAPGRYADLLIVPNIKTIQPEMVISNGRVVVENGKVQVLPRAHAFSDQSLHSVNLKRSLLLEDFSVPAGKAARFADVRVIEQVTDLVTRELKATLSVKDEKVLQDPSRDILKVAAIDRAKHPGRMFVGFIKGFFVKRGAFASSSAWDSSDIIVVGADDSDMACAVNRIAELQGGAVVCVQGMIKAELPLPILGLISDKPLKRLQRDLASINTAASALGMPFKDPLLTLVTLTGAAIPYLRICEEGLVHLKDGLKRDLILRLRE